MRRVAALLAVVAIAACAELGVEPDGETAAISSEATEDAPASALGEAAETSDTESASAETAPEAGRGDGENPSAAGDAPDTFAADAPGTAASAAEVGNAPHVYMALQPDGGGVSVVFAIDRSRDNTPSDEPAIRITPEETEAGSGRCNPQQLRYYRFQGDSAERPIYGPDEAARGVGARDLPEFMATAVSSEMMERGIAADLEETRPQNVCTRKLFQQTIIAASTGQG